MIVGRIGCKLTVLAILCVLSTFFFPPVQGPYSAAHGPVTALRAARSAAQLRMGTGRAAQNGLREGALSWSLLPFLETESDPKFQSASLSEFTDILRC
jgi:hypothetical protein